MAAEGNVSGQCPALARSVDVTSSTLADATSRSASAREPLTGAGDLSCAATFVEPARWIDRSRAITAFADRRAAPSAQAHHDAAALVDRSEHADPGGQMYDAFVRVLEQRPATRTVEVIPGDIDQTFVRFEDALDISAQ